jgi:hypothetical protein
MRRGECTVNRPDGEPEIPMSEERDIVVLPDQTLDETGEGWGERYGERDRDSEERLLADRPPHWEH